MLLFSIKIFERWLLTYILSCIITCVTVVSMEDPFPPEHYDKRESGKHGVPQWINVTMYVESVVSIDISTMEYFILGYVIQEWHDERLKGAVHSIIVRDVSSIWLPDIYCLNCRKSTLNSKDNDNFLLRVDPNGHVFYSQLAQLHASCYMNLLNFPFDRQVCPLNLSSYGYTNEFLEFRWKSTPAVKKVQLAQFTVSDKVTPYEIVNVYPAGNFTILSFELNFSRQVGFYLLQVFIPCAVLVCSSWMIVFMEASDIGDRLSIGVTLILTMIFLLGYINQSLPKVSYIKAVDWYVIVSLAMILLSVLESVFVYWLLHKKKAKEQESLLARTLAQSNQMMLPRISQPENDRLHPPSRNSHSCSRNSIYLSVSQHDVTNNVDKELINDGGSCYTRKFKQRNDFKTENKFTKCDAENNGKTILNKDIIVRVDAATRVILPLIYIVFNIIYGLHFAKHIH